MEDLRVRAEFLYNSFIISYVKLVGLDLPAGAVIINLARMTFTF